MKKTIIALALLAVTLSACDQHPQTYQQQPQVVYTQPQQPVLVQQQPVIVHQQSNTGELLGAAALGAMVGRATAPSPTYQQPQSTTIINKTVVVKAPSASVPAQQPTVSYKTPPRVEQPRVAAPTQQARPAAQPTMAYKAPARTSAPSSSSSSFKVKR